MYSSANAVQWITQQEQQSLLFLLEHAPDLDDTLIALLARLKGNGDLKSASNGTAGISRLRVLPQEQFDRMLRFFRPGRDLY